MTQIWQLLQKNGKSNHEPGTSNTGSNSENKSDDACEGVVPKLSKVTEDINEVMSQLQQQADSELLPLLHPTSIKQYVLKKKAVIGSNKLHY
jgi:hypothetical protein